MTMEVEVFYSFRSPYSYLSTARMRELVARYDLEFNIRTVLPIAVRTPEFFDKVNPLFGPYLQRDVRRVGDYLEVPFRWPVPDPVVMELGDADDSAGAAVHMADIEARRGCGGARPLARVHLRSRHDDVEREC